MLEIFTGYPSLATVNFMSSFLQDITLKNIDGLQLLLNSRSFPLSTLSAYQECKKEDLQKKNRPSSG